jgi:acyl-CoA synthetase (AMP-forming)/AMP-acid ligase II
MAHRITYGSWFADRAARSGHRVALTFEGRSWTYAEMLDEVDRLAAVLVGGGAVRETGSRTSARTIHACSRPSSPVPGRVRSSCR